MTSFFAVAAGADVRIDWRRRLLLVLTIATALRPATSHVVELDVAVLTSMELPRGDGARWTDCGVSKELCSIAAGLVLERMDRRDDAVGRRRRRSRPPT